MRYWCDATTTDVAATSDGDGIVTGAAGHRDVSTPTAIIAIGAATITVDDTPASRSMLVLEVRQNGKDEC